MLTALHQDVHILMLQEEGFHLTSSLSSILPGYHQICALLEDGCGGSSLLIHSKFMIVSTDIIHSGLGSFHVASIYGLASYTERATLWKALNDNLPKGKELDTRRGI